MPIFFSEIKNDEYEEFWIWKQENAVIFYHFSVHLCQNLQSTLKQSMLTTMDAVRM